MHQTQAAASLRRCITRSMRAKDGRGAAQAERLCALELSPQPTTIDRNCAAAARRLGEWIARQPA